jgi:hypothetical protein
MQLDMYIPKRISIAPVVEVRGEAERFAIVVLVGSPGDAERFHMVEECSAHAGDGETLFAVEHVQGESVGVVVASGPAVHLMASVIDLLAGHGEGAACRRFFELDAAILLWFDEEDKLVDLVAGLGGELEEDAVALSIC